MNLMEQLLAFCDWERKNNPHLDGGQHVAEWAAAEIERLHAEMVRLKEHPPMAQPLTQKQIVDAFCERPHHAQFVVAFEQGARFAERHHGITLAGKESP